MFKDLSSNIRTIYRKVKVGYSLVRQTATDKPKVPSLPPASPAVYDVPPAVYDKLVEFKAKRSLQSVEMAVNVILSEYFGLSQTLDTTTDTPSRIESLEAKCTSLSETVAELRAAIATLQSSSNPPNQSDLPTLDTTSSTQIDQSKPADPTIESSLHVDYGKQLASSQVLNQTADDSLHLPSSELSEATTLPDSLVTQSAQPQGTPDKLEAESRGEAALDESPSQQLFSTPITQVALAKRLAVSTSSISRMQSKPNFPEWSQQKDPEGIAWVRLPKGKGFSPQTHK